MRVPLFFLTGKENMRKNDEVTTGCQRMYSLDVLKCVCALCVVGIHFGANARHYPVAEIVRVTFYRMAVPAFFIITGYYYPQLLQKRQHVRHLKKIVQMTLGAALFYLLFNIVDLFFRGGLPQWFMQSGHRLHSFLYFNVPFLSMGHLWYFYALIYALLVMIIIDKLKWWGWGMKLLSVGLLVIGLYGNYCFPYYIQFRNFLFYAFPSIAIGRMLGEEVFRRNILRISDTTLGVMVLVGLLLTIAEYGFSLGIRNHKEFYLGNYVVACSLLLLCVRHPAAGGNTFAATIGRKYSAYIFIFHEFVGILFVRYVPQYTSLFWGMFIKTTAVFAGSLLMAMLWKRLVAWKK